jgi:Heparinase II/III-like protein/Heparinase II/III N-terminus
MKSKNLSLDTAVTTSPAESVLLQPRQVFRSDTRWGRSIIEWPSLGTFLESIEIKSGVHSLPIGEFSGRKISYDFLLTARPGTTLLCHFHGNSPREGMDLPIFTGLGVTSSIATSMFIPSDPTLALDKGLSLAWHFGCEGLPLQAITVSIVNKLREVLKSPRVVTWGGSGGGFAAIRVARDVPHSIALAWNPQTDIVRYVQEPVSRYLRIAFPKNVERGVFPSGKDQFSSLCREEFTVGYQGRIVYLQESTDWHVNDHLDPFLRSFSKKSLSEITGDSIFSGCVNDQLYLHLGHWGNGHVPPSKDTVAKFLMLLSDHTRSLQDLQSLAGEAFKASESKILQHESTEKGGEAITSNLVGALAESDSVLDLNDVLAIRMDRIAENFNPFDVSINCSGDLVDVPLFTGENMEVSIAHGVKWDKTFSRQVNSSVMWQFSLASVGRLLSTFEKKGDADYLKIAVVVLTSFLDYSAVPGNQLRIGRIPSGDHSAATRVKVLIKFIQLMRGRAEADQSLLFRVCECLKYWSDWLVDPKHYKKNNHGLMGSIALLHSAVQFGDAPYAKQYLDVAIDRIVELGKSSFDRDGLCDENSIGYHNFNLHCYRGLLGFCNHYQLSETLILFLEELILRATNALASCIWQDGSVPPIGDSQVYPLKIASENKSRCFYQSGFAVVKNEDLYLSLLCGARTEIHKQVDDTSITLRYKNRDILIDGGAYLYDQADPHRRCVESSLGHSGIFLKDFGGLVRREFLKEFGPVSGRIESFEESEDGVRIKCVYSVNNGRTVFKRNIFVCWPDEVAIVDFVESKDMTSTSGAVQRFLFGSTFDVQFSGRNKLVLTSDGFSCNLFQLSDCTGELYRGEQGNLVRGWFSKKYKEILPTCGVDFSQNDQVCRFSTVIKLAQCTSLSQCSASVQKFAAQAELP